MAVKSIRSGKRFNVALSFPGEHRNFVQMIAETLKQHLHQEQIFYDKWYEAELARLNMDTYLQLIYQNNAELIVVFICAEYEKKKWCKLEWRAIRDLIEQNHDQNHDESIMLIRLDETVIPGIFSIDGYIDATNREPEEIASLILQRLNLMNLNQQSVLSLSSTEQLEPEQQQQHLVAVVQDQNTVRQETECQKRVTDAYTQLNFKYTGSFNQGTPVTLLAVTSDKKILVAGNREYGIIRLWDLNSYELLFEFSIEDGVRSLAISTDNKILATSSGRKIRKWHLSNLVNRNASQSEVLCEFPTGLANVGVIGFLRNNFEDDLMAVGYGDKVQLWRVNASYDAVFLRDLLPSEREHYYHMEEYYYYADAEEQFSRPILEVCCLSFSPDGIYIAAGYKRWHPDTETGLGNNIRIWHCSTGEIVHTLWGHEWETKALAFSPDGKVMASCGLENEIRLWDVETGEEIMKGSTIKGSSRTSSINFNADGRILFSGEESGVIRLWDFQNGKHIGNLEGGKGSVNSIIFIHNKQTLISGNGDGTIHIWTPNNK